MEFLCFAVFAVCLSADLILKSIAETHLNKPIIFLCFELSRVENRGAAFGLLNKKPMLLNVLTGIMIAMITINCIWFTDNLVQQLTLSTALAGASGNFIWRLRKGYVIDYIRINRGRMPYINLADLLILISCIIYFIVIV